jgi:hypothetical protein
MPRQSDQNKTVQEASEEARRKFAEQLNKRLEEFGVEREVRGRWLQERTGARWQTCQFWLQGRNFPKLEMLLKLGEVLGLSITSLIGPAAEDMEPSWPSWREFLATPEGASMDDFETWSLRLAGWRAPPTVGDYRQMLALYRSNAERAK